MEVKLFAVEVERNIYTTVKTTVPVHELAVMDNVFGGENMTVSEEPVGKMTLGEPSEEWERLILKYGRNADDKPVVSEVYPTHKAFVAAVQEGALEVPKEAKAPAKAK